MKCSNDDILNINIYFKVCSRLKHNKEQMPGKLQASAISDSHKRTAKFIRALLLLIIVIT